MAYSLETITDDILELLRSKTPIPVYEDYVPDARTLRRNEAGTVDPYIVVQFGDPLPGRNHSMVGPKADDYGYPIYLQAIAPDAALARKIANRCVHYLLGATAPWAGSMRKRAGFNMFTIDSSTGAVEAYAAPRFFTLTIQIEDDV